MPNTQLDRRQYPRFLCSGKADVCCLVSGSAVRGRIANLSLGSCLIRLEHESRFQPHEAVEITFAVRQLPVRVQGTVCQVHHNRGVGVRFTMLSERGRRQLRELILELGDLRRDQMAQGSHRVRRA